MNTPFLEFLARYWSRPEIAVNAIVFANLLGARLLGLVVGYERSYHGRAAGMRTYGLVCMAACALTVVFGYPSYWYGGATLSGVSGMGLPDPGRVIQGIVTGIGFLGAGVIMKEGLSISGLTTAASIWSSSAIGVLVGLGFYGAAILLTLLSAALMMWASRLEQWLPSHPALSILLRFRPGFLPSEEQLKQLASDWGYAVARDTFSIQQSNGRQEWRYIALARDKSLALTPSALAAALSQVDGVEDFQISHARN